MRNKGNVSAVVKGRYCACQVCNLDLDKARSYYQRNYICEEHSKAEWCDINDERVRWCQQCRKFQPLDDFDLDRRTCRSRLQRHNFLRKRRGRQSDARRGNASSPTVSTTTISNEEGNTSSVEDESQQYNSVEITLKDCDIVPSIDANTVAEMEIVAGPQAPPSSEQIPDDERQLYQVLEHQLLTNVIPTMIAPATEYHTEDLKLWLDGLVSSPFAGADASMSLEEIQVDHKDHISMRDESSDFVSCYMPTTYFQHSANHKRPFDGSTETTPSSTTEDLVANPDLLALWMEFRTDPETWPCIAPSG